MAVFDLSGSKSLGYGRREKMLNDIKAGTMTTEEAVVAIKAERDLMAEEARRQQPMPEPDPIEEEAAPTPDDGDVDDPALRPV